jgi:hypothetical protein
MVIGLIAATIAGRGRASMADGGAAARALHELFEADWQWRLKEDPKVASMLGDTPGVQDRRA